MLERQSVTARWQLGPDCIAHRQGPGRRLGLLLSMARFYTTAATHLQQNSASLQQLRGLLSSRTKLALEKVSSGRNIHQHLRQLRTAAAETAPVHAKATPHQARQRRRIALPLTGAAVGLAAGSGLALLVACEFDRVSDCLSKYHLCSK